MDKVIFRKWVVDVDRFGAKIWRLSGTDWKVRKDKNMGKPFTVLKGEGDNQISMYRFRTLSQAKEVIKAEAT